MQSHQTSLGRFPSSHIDSCERGCACPSAEGSYWFAARHINQPCFNGLTRLDGFRGTYSASTPGQEALWVWAAQEGIDVTAATYRAPGADKDYYCLKAVEMQAWEVPNERWDTIAEEVKQDLPLELGRPAGELLMHYDSEQTRYVPNRRATFLFITREGTPGILRLTTQVLPQGPPVAQADPSAKNDPVAAFRKRYGLSLARPTAAQNLSPNQDEQEAGREPVGVKIEYKFFVRESGG